MKKKTPTSFHLLHLQCWICEICIFSCIHLAFPLFGEHSQGDTMLCHWDISKLIAMIHFRLSCLKMKNLEPLSDITETLRGTYWNIKSDFNRLRNQNQSNKTKCFRKFGCFKWYFCLFVGFQKKKHFIAKKSIPFLLECFFFWRRCRCWSGSVIFVLITETNLVPNKKKS